MTMKNKTEQFRPDKHSHIFYLLDETIQKCMHVELNHSTRTLQHCGRKESLITLDILFQWLGGRKQLY